MKKQIDENEFDYQKIVEKLHTINEIQIPSYIETYHKENLINGINYYWELIKACRLFQLLKTDASIEGDYDYKQRMWEHRYKKTDNIIIDYCKTKCTELENPIFNIKSLFRFTPKKVIFSSLIFPDGNPPEKATDWCDYRLNSDRENQIANFGFPINGVTVQHVWLIYLLRGWFYVVQDVYNTDNEIIDCIYINSIQENQELFTAVETSFTNGYNNALKVFNDTYPEPHRTISSIFTRYDKDEVYQKKFHTGCLPIGFMHGKNNFYAMGEMEAIYNKLVELSEAYPVEYKKYQIEHKSISTTKAIEKTEQSENKPDENNEKIHPTIADKYDAELIYSHFVNVIFKGDKNDYTKWLVDGVKGNKTLGLTDTTPKAQLKKFIQTITNNETDTKEAYFRKVFNEIIPANIKTTGLKKSIEDKLKLCEKAK